MKTNFLSAVIVLLITVGQPVSAQTTTQKKPGIRVTLSGKITDSKSGEPLAGASIYLHDLKTGSISDAQGLYRIQNISAGKYLLEISYLGYSSIAQPIELSG